jgi:hypothetical protein
LSGVQCPRAPPPNTLQATWPQMNWRIDMCSGLTPAAWRAGAVDTGDREATTGRLRRQVGWRVSPPPTSVPSSRCERPRSIRLGLLPIPWSPDKTSAHVSLWPPSHVDGPGEGAPAH